YIVNASGVNLTDAELALAQISGYWPDARERIKKKLFELEKEGWVFKLDFFIYVLLGCLHQVGSKMEKLHDQENLVPLKNTWFELESNTLDYVFNILRSQAYIDHTKEINSVYALVPIIVYAFRKGKTKMTDTEIKKAIKWFYYSQVRNRYISQLPQKLDKDISIVANENNPFDKLLNLIESERRLEITPDEFIGVGVMHPLWALMNWYLKSRNAKCLTTGVSLRKNMGKKYSLECDHIFPFSILKKNGYGWENRHKYSLAQEITNRAILTKTANRTKSNKEAKNYLAEVQQNFPNALELQSIPTDNRLWELENYEQFLQTRRKLLAKQLNTFLKSISTTSEEALSMSVAELIEQGENASLELKTTLRWDLKLNKINKKLEEVILKTIAAFSNGEGGTLIIGVNDEGEIEGLQHDYATLTNGDKDKFELHLRNLLNKEYGIDFATNNLKILFPEIEDKEICMVEIKAGLKPLYTTITDNNGNKAEKFYVRSGNSSQEVSLSEIAEFITKRFEK
ncbi:MAG: putative DNA binding domain-containing protein, partial [Synergistaceae bacterium]|nr:putative DNA binding domain-containing protein [Synergistaceae bacterium]